MIARDHRSRPGSSCPGPRERAQACTRCGEISRTSHPFTLDTEARRAALCSKCQGEWDDLILDVGRRWHQGLRSCFFCLRVLGDHLFPARSPFGICCAECGVVVSALGGGFEPP